jgi:hypothetical protein
MQNYPTALSQYISRVSLNLQYHFCVKVSFEPVAKLPHDSYDFPRPCCRYSQKTRFVQDLYASAFRKRISLRIQNPVWPLISRNAAVVIFNRAKYSLRLANDFTSSPFYLALSSPEPCSKNANNKTLEHGRLRLERRFEG